MAALETDITASTKIAQDGLRGDPYIREIPVGLIGGLLKGIYAVGKVAGAAMTVVSGTVTIPKGTILLLETTDMAAKVELTADVTILTDATNVKVYAMLASTGNRFQVMLGAGATVPTGALELATVSGGPPPSAIAENTAVAKSAPNRKTISVLLPAAETAGSRFVVSPYSGRITKIWATPQATIDATTVITAKIATVAVTNGAVSLTNTGAAGTVYSATPTAANVIGKGAAIELASDGAQTAALAVEVQIEITE